MASGRNLRDPLLAIEFLSLTFGCSARPLSQQTSSETGTTTLPTSEGTELTGNNTGDDTELTDNTELTADTDVGDWNMSSSSSWGPDGYNDDSGYYWYCDPLSQDCPHLEKCVPVFNDEGLLNRTFCVPIGDKPIGSPCTHQGFDVGVDDCDASGTCWFVEDGVGVCVPFCGGVPDALTCPDELMCFHSWTDAMALFVCVDACDPFTQDCPAGQACHWSQEGFGCSPSNDVPPLEPCASLLDCSAGGICIDAQSLGDSCAGDACCVAYCDVDLADSCTQYPGSVCTSFWGAEPPPPELAGLGLCLQP